jgi:methylenetetrahydrofolate dehydrogenase (NADP+)/methenyltetrahydrofolate cyclohydrolase
VENKKLTFPPMQLIDGKKIASEIKDEIALEVKEMVARGHKAPHLAAVLVGHDGGSETYVAAKVKACGEVGFRSTLIRFEDNISESTLLETVDKLNNDAEIDGFIVQLPLPAHISEQKVIEAIDPSKDVDGFHPVNVGRMVLGLPAFVSATPAGILELISRHKIPTAGRNCVVVGRSNNVGKPMGMLLSLKAYPGDATVTLCHSRTADLPGIIRRADIIIAALGKAEFITGDMIKEGAVVIDVGITRVPSPTTKSGWKLLGDVKFDEVAPKCSYITPVPGGVGPMTIVSLLKNTLKAANLRSPARQT